MRMFENWQLRKKILVATSVPIIVGSIVVIWASQATYSNVSTRLIPQDRDFANMQLLAAELISQYHEYVLHGDDKAEAEIGALWAELHATQDKVRQLSVSSLDQSDNDRIDMIADRMLSIGAQVLQRKKQLLGSQSDLHDLGFELMSTESGAESDTQKFGREFAANLLATTWRLMRDSGSVADDVAFASFDRRQVGFTQKMEQMSTLPPGARRTIEVTGKLLKLATDVVDLEQEMMKQIEQLDDIHMELGAVAAARSSQISNAIDREFASGILWLTLSGALIALATGAILVVTVSSVVSRLRRIENALVKFRKGDLEAKAPIDSNDEIGRLATKFNKMATRVANTSHERKKVETDLRELSASLETQVRERTADLRKAVDTAESASRAKSTFLSNMSHELRTPLNAIIGYGEMLEEDARAVGDSESADDLGRIVSAGRRLLALINDILDMAKIDAGKVTPVVALFDLASVVQDVIAAVAPLIEDNHNELTSGDLAININMRSDASLVRQILLNIVTNAAKFTNDGAISIDVRRLQVDGSDSVEIVVSDSGIGMTQTSIETAFQQFVQSDLSTTREHGGSGLGLSICKQLCELLGGEIALHSILGRGTEVRIRLPLEMTDTISGPVQADLSALVTIEQSDLNSILIIDDDPEACQLLQYYLSKLNCRVLAAGGCAEGLHMARTDKPDMIILDVYMPDADGWSTLQELKADERTSGIPVIMCTISDRKQYGFSLGASGYIAKPVDRTLLLKVVGQFSNHAGKTHVMVVEDDAASRDLMNRALSNSGCEVMLAENGVEGLAKLEVQRPDLVLLDLMMPKMDGFEFIKRVKENADWRDIPIIVVTIKVLTAAERQQLIGNVDRIVDKNAKSSIESMIRDIIETAELATANTKTESIDT